MSNKKTEIIPAILPESYAELSDKIYKAKNSASLVQVDICDGKLTSASTWPYERGKIPVFNDDFEMPFWESLDFELDLMILNPENHIDNLKNLGCTRAVIHFGSTTLEGLITAGTLLDAYDIEVGVAITNDTEMAELKKVLSGLEESSINAYVQVMGIGERGKQGQPFDGRTLDTLKKLRTEYPNTILQVDGSVSDKVARLLIESGASRLVVGSWLYNEQYTVQNRITILKNLIY